MEFLLYFIPLLVFVILFTSFYYNTPKDSRKTSIIKNILPSTVVSLMFFYFIKYSESGALKSEPMMMGNYFD